MTTIAPQLELPATDHTPRKYDGPPKSEVIAMRKQYTNPAVYTIYKEP
jgi:alanine-glyoxylate transaminase/(R)-3-amino-2-methylpropionate-pyruvate transaminase